MRSTCMKTMRSLLLVFLLYLSEGESHVDGGPVGLETALRFWVDSLCKYLESLSATAAPNPGLPRLWQTSKGQFFPVSGPELA